MAVKKILILAILAISCGKKSDSGRPVPVLEPKVDSSEPFLADSPYEKNSDSSLIECKRTEAADHACRLISKSIVLLANSEQVLRTYRVSYDFNCRFAGSTSTVDSSFRLMAQPPEDGLVFAPLFLNKKDTITIHGTGDLRIEPWKSTQIGPEFEKGCYLTVNHEIVP